MAAEERENWKKGGANNRVRQGRARREKWTAFPNLFSLTPSGGEFLLCATVEELVASLCCVVR